jgi:hypothetical protein
MITKTITFCGQKATHACDGRCDKAWGHNSRLAVPPAMPDFSVRLYNIAPHRRDA